MIPFQVDRNWYQRYWLEEHAGRAPQLQALIGIVGLFRSMRNGVSASVDAGVPSSREVKPQSVTP